MKSICQSTDPVGPVPSSLSINEVVDDKVAGGDETYGDKASRDASFFKQIISWCLKI